MSFAEWTKKKKEQEEASKSNSSNITPNNGGVSFEEWSKKKSVEMVNQDYINAFVTDANGFFSSANENYKNVGYGNASSLYSTTQSAMQDLRGRANKIGKWLELNKDRLDEKDYTSLSDTLSAFKKDALSVVSNFSKAEEYYSQWETEDDYNKAVASTEEYERLKNLDIEATESAIKMLEAGGRSGAMLDKKKTDLAKAKRIQKAIELSGVADSNSEYYDSNFDNYAGYKSTKMGDASWWDKLWSDYGGYKDSLYEYVNNKAKVDGRSYREAYEMNYSTMQMDNPYSDGESKYEEMNIDQMTQDEIDIFNYYYNTQGKEKAEEYLDSIQESLNTREATKMFGNLEGNTGLEMLFGVVAGLDQFSSGIKNLFSDEDYYVPSSTQITSGMVREDLEDSGVKIFGNSVGQMGYDAITTTSNMLPSILVGTATGGTGTVISMGASAAGNAKAQMINLGYSKAQANAYGLMVGASEALLEKVLGGIVGVSDGGIFSKLATKALGKIDNALGRVAIQFGASMADEFVEESLQTVLEPWFESVLTGADFDAPDIDEVLYSGLLGALTAGVFEIGGTVVGQGAIAENNAIRKQGKELMAQGIDINKLAELGKDTSFVSADSVAYRLAGKVNEKTGAYTIARLFNELKTNAQLTTQNQADIIRSLERKGVTPKHAKTLATALANVVAGVEITKKQAKRLDSNPEVAKTMQDVILNPNSTVRQRMTQFNESVFPKSTEATTETSQEATEQAQTVAPTENSTLIESAENKPENVSDDGKTKQISTGEEISIKRIASTKNGLSVELDNGSVIKASDISYATNEEATMMEMLSRMETSPEVATEIFNSFKPTDMKQALNYFVNIPLAYNYGKIGYKQGLNNVKMSKEESYRAYNQGRKYAEAKAVADTKTPSKADTKTEAKTEKGGIIYENGFTYDESKATKIQKVSMAHIDVIRQMTNLEVHVFESVIKDGKRVAFIDGKWQPAPNGFFRNGNQIYIDINAGDKGEGAMLSTMGHEVAHYIRRWNAKGFKELADFLFKHYGHNGVSVDALIETQKEKIIKRYKFEGKELPSEAKLYDMAYEEVVADAMSDMLSDPKAYEKLAQLKSENRTLWQKIGEAIKSVLDKLKSALGIYKNAPVPWEAQHVRDFAPDVYNKLQDLYIKAFVEADANYEAAEKNLAENGIAVDSETDSGTLMSVRDVLDDTEREKVAKILATRFDVTQQEALEWLKAETSLASLILNPKYSQYLDYTADANEEAIKSNSDYPQGTVDFSNICKKRRDFTEIMNRILRSFPNHIFEPTDLAKIRTIMEQEGMEVACAICYVEDRRQQDSVVAQDFINSLALYREGSKTRPDGKAFNANQLKALKLIDGSTYTPSIYELITLEGRNELKAKNPAMEEAWVKFNNARGMQSVRLLLNDAEYKRQILKYNKNTVKSKNNNGGLRIYSFSDMEMFHLIDIIQVITDSATVGLSIQGYTKVNEYAKAVKDTGEKLNRSLIPKGDLGYHMEKGKVVLDFDTVEGIDINHPDFFDSTDNPNVGNIVIGINPTQIRAAMMSKFIDYIIPFHTGQSKEVLGEKGIAEWVNYKDSQTEKDLETGKTSQHQINIYTEVIQAAEKAGKPITNKVEFVNKFLEVCKENNLIPRFAEFLNMDENGNYVYTEGYHKFLVDFKTFDSNTGEYLPQMPVKPIFDSNYLTKLLRDYVKTQKVKDAEFAEKSPKVIERITNEIIKPKDTKYSDRDSWNNIETIQGLESYSVEEVIDITKSHIQSVLEEYGEYAEIIAVRPLGSRAKGTAKADSDLDIVVQYEGDIREDDMFNMLNDEDSKLYIEGIVVDINPIRADESGDIEDYLGRVYDYDKYSETKYSDRDSLGNELSQEQQEFFKDSKVRDSEGRLTVVYHGTPNGGFTEFKLPQYLRTLTSAQGAGYYFTNELNARQYMKGHNGKYVTKKKLYKVYLNITNPLQITEYSTGAISDDAFRRIMARGNYEWGMAHTDVEKILGWVTRDADKLAEMVKVFNGEEILSVMKEELGYDGVRFTDKYGDIWVAWDKSQIKETTNKNPTPSADIRYSDRVTDQETLDFLNEQISRGEYDAKTNPNGGYYVTYKSMSFWGYDEEGNAILRSPMAEYVDGKLSDAYLIPKKKGKHNWYRATETIDEKTGLPKGLLVKTQLPGRKSDSYLPASEHQDLIEEDWSNLYFNLRKKVLKDGKWVTSDVPARYNPYEHSSNSMLNDQFEAAYLRDNLVTVKMYVPVSEDNATFRAKYSKDATGWTDWKSGKVATKINKQKDLQRRLYLSRYATPVEIVPDSEVAQAYKEYLKDTDVAVPDNVVSPSLLKELKKIGVPIIETGKVSNSDIKYSERDSYASTFYSHMGKVVDGIKSEKVGAGGVVSYLKGKGVKNEEIKWSGIEAWLEGKKSVTKAELQEFIAGSQLQIQEQMSGNATYMTEDGTVYDGLSAFKDAAYATAKKQGINRERVKFINDSEFGEIYAYVGNINNVILSATVGDEYGTAPRWSDYKLDGGENYRELVFVMPNSSYSNRAMIGHWGHDAEGVLAHARIQDFTVDGKKMLFIEELQSDWHNEGHKDGYQEDAKFKELQELEAKANEAFYAVEDYSTELTGLAGEYEAVAKTQKGRELLRAKIRAEKELKQAQAQFDSKVPDAPFRNNYHEYVLKRLLRMAAEEGYDSIGWTPADIQSKRWSEDYAEGYRIEYDQDIPSFLKKYGKKWGAKVGTATVNGDTEVWSMDITDSMKDSVLYDGQVMYSERDYFVEDKYFKSQMSKWQDLKHGSYVKVGVIGEKHPLCAVGMPTGVLRYDVDKLKKNMADHGDYLDVDMLKAIPDIIANPIAISEYSEENTVSVFGDIFVKNSPMMVGVTISKDRSGNDINKVRTYNARRDVGKLITDETILYLNEDKKRTRKWFQACGIQVPLGETKFGFIRIISQNDDPVKTKFQDRDTELVSNRTLLANALESVAQNDIEKDKLQQYKDKIALIEKEEAHLEEVKAEIKEISFTKGSDRSKLKKLNEEKTRTANRINTYDKQLLNLESTTALKNVLQREKEMARKREKQKGYEVLKAYKEKALATQREIITRNQESRKKAVENRHKTEMRHKIKKVVSDLNKLLLHGTKERNIKPGLQEAVASALEAINMDTVSADARIVKLTQDLLMAKTPEKIEEIQHKIDYIKNMGDRMSDKLEALGRAYREIKNSTGNEYSSQFKEEASLIENKIESVISKVGKTPLRDMSLSQLELVYDLYTMVLTTVRNANGVWRQGKLEDLQQNASAVMAEIDEMPKIKSEGSKFRQIVRAFKWNNMTPYYAFDTIGSNTLKKFFNDFIEAQNTYARDVAEVKEFAHNTREKYNYNKWDLDKVYDFKLKDGRTFSTTLKHMLSIYAYSKREQALDHMSVGGFFHNDKATFRKKGGIIEMVRTDDVGYKVDWETLEEIKEALGKEKMLYVDEMQEYLTKMGEKGNEVTRVMWGIDIFKEKVYFPLKSKNDFIKSSTETAQAVSLKNDGMTKETVPGASNPIVLEAFDDVWARHTERMSQYHSFVIPIDNLNKIHQYGTWAGTDSMAVSTLLAGRFGNAVNEYISQFIKDMNGNVVSQGVTNPFMSFFSKFKKTAVGMSLSTIVQQPTAIVRAMSLVDGKYFVGKPNLSSLSKKWDELKTYAPIAIIKEIGGFDAGSGVQVTNWINSDALTGVDKVMNVIDDVSMKGAELADKLGWTSIWEAVKRETKATTNLEVGSEAFLKKAGERFTEVIVQTQVYDSTLSRSGFMRSKNDGVKMLTAFMGEPTLSVNMLYNSVVNAMRGGSKLKAAKTIGCVYVSSILASAFASAIYALNDDDEDESYLEKYMQAFGGEFISDIVLMPVTSLPAVKDVISIFQGWDIERTDVAIFKDIKDAFDGLFSENKSGYKKIEDFAGAIGSMFGLPVKNLLKTGRQIYNSVNDIFVDKITGGNLGEAFLEGITNEKKSKTKKLYDAIVSGDTARLEVLREDYEDEDAYTSAIRKALRENDPRIQEAAQALSEGDVSEYGRIIDEIADEGNFEALDIKSAIESELNKIEKENSTEEDTPSEDKAESIYEAEHYYMALIKGDTYTANKVKEDIINTEAANGKSREDAEQSFYSSFRNKVRDGYADGTINRTKAMEMLVSYGGMESNDAYWTMDKYDYYKQNGSYDGYSKYGDFHNAVRTGVNLKSVIQEYTSHGVEKQTLASQITSYFKPLYINMTNSERAGIKGYLLNAYAQLGYNRYEKSRDIDKWLQ